MLDWLKSWREMNMSNDETKKTEQDALQVINDPKNFISREELEAQDGVDGKGISRRNLLKYSGAAAAALSMAGSAATGMATGKSSDGYTGYGRTYNGDDQFFNRKNFEAETAAMMEPVGEVTRPNWYDLLFERRRAVGALVSKKLWNPDMGVEAMPGEIGDYYRERPISYAALVESYQLLANRQKWWKEEGHKRYAIAYAYTKGYSSAMYNHAGSTIPVDPNDIHMKEGKPIPPEDWDYRGISANKMEFKSPAHASQLIKAIGHMFGASFVRICKLDERFVFKNLMRGMPNRGWDNWGDKIPDHWKSMIVFGHPMQWDTTQAAIGYSTSYDGYFRVKLAAGMTETFLKAIGYPARAQWPGNHYEVMMTPYTLLSGMGEYSRAGLVMVPEVGANMRPAGVITNVDFEYDKPININMAKFCMKCKICAETCPTGAIPFDDEPTTVVRGFKRWLLDEEKCYRQWVAGTTFSGDGCRVCIAVCPFSRKNTWIHAISRELDARDSLGIVGTTLLAMQQNFFKYPKGEEFRAGWDGGREATYHDPIWWERSEDFFSNIEKTWEYEGMH